MSPIGNFGPPKPPKPKAVEQAMDVCDEACEGLMGPKAPACRALVFKMIFRDNASREEIESAVEEKFR